VIPVSERPVMSIPWAGRRLFLAREGRMNVIMAGQPDPRAVGDPADGLVRDWGSERD
jgi:hypothetical protein